MGAFLPVAGVIFAAAITPGPNNFIVLEAGARHGLAAAARASLGVVLGSLLLLALISLGLGPAMDASPALRLGLSLGGGAYLAWLGVSLAFKAGVRADARRSLPSSTLGVAAFQILNPKAWVLVATTAAAAMAGADQLAVLAALIAVITSLCLAVWALAGAALSRVLADPRARLWLDRTMGALLAVSALGLVVDAFA